MNKNQKNLGIGLLTAAALAYPAYRVIKYLIAKYKPASEEGEVHFAPSYRSKQARAHNRKADALQHHNHNHN